MTLHIDPIRTAIHERIRKNSGLHANCAHGRRIETLNFLGTVMFAAVIIFLRRQFSAEARDRRRRRRNYRPIVSKSKGMTVKLAVNLPKPKD